MVCAAGLCHSWIFSFGSELFIFSLLKRGTGIAHGLPYGPNSVMTLRMVRILTPGTRCAGLEELA